MTKGKKTAEIGKGKTSGSDVKQAQGSAKGSWDGPHKQVKSGRFRQPGANKK